MKEKVSGQKEWITDQGVAVNEKEMKRFAIIDAVSSCSWSIYCIHNYKLMKRDIRFKCKLTATHQELIIKKSFD